MYIIFRCRLILNCVKTSWWTWSNPSGMRITTRSQSYQLICLGCVRVLHLSQSKISPSILTRQISSTHDIASWNAFLKVHTWNHWLVLNDWLRIRIQNCRSLRSRSSFSSWLLVKSIVIDETLVILERMQTPFCFLKRLDMLEIAYIEGSPLLVDESVPLRFVRVEFLLDSNYRFPSAVRSHLPSLRSWSDLRKTCLWLVSSSHGWLHPISRRHWHWFGFGWHNCLKSSIRLGKLFLLKTLGWWLQLNWGANSWRGWKDHHLSGQLLRNLVG